MSSGFNSVQFTSQEILVKPNVSTVSCCLQWLGIQCGAVGVIAEWRERSERSKANNRVLFEIPL